MKLSSMRAMRRIVSYLLLNKRETRLRIVSACIVTCIMIMMSLSIPLVFKMVIDVLICPTTFSQHTILLILAGYGVCWLVSQVIRQVKEMFVFRILEKGMRSLTLDIFNHIQTLSVRFHLDRQTGSLMSQIENARYGFEAACWGIMSFLFPTIVEIILAITLLTYLYGVVYGGLMFLIMATYLLFSVIFLEKAAQARELYNEKRAKATARMVDSLLNYETVKYFAHEKHETTQVDLLLKRQEDEGVKSLLMSSWVSIGQGVIIGVGLLVVTLLSGSAVYNHAMSVGDFALINGYVLQFVMPLSFFGHILQQVRKGLQDMKAVLKIMDTPPEIIDRSDALECAADSVDIVFNAVSFGYGVDRTILDTLSFVIPAGKTVALVGPTGSGKSTITRLLFRLYDVNTGSILVNGHDIRELSQHSLRNMIGIVAQETMLFNDTLYYNIAYGNINASEDEVKHAAQLAHLDTFIAKLPDGYNTIVGERGLKLSGGEKQRIAIARVLLKNPLVYVFDEATSSLDMRTEKEIQKNLEEISVGKTTLITHRLSTIMHANTILVLDNGSIVEQGSHEELLALQGLYFRLWNAQK